MPKESYNLESINRSLVPEKYSLARIDRYLAGRFSYLSRTEWQGEINKGNIYHNGARISSHHKKVRAGDEVQFISMDIKEPGVDKNYSVLYEDEFFFVINKPPDIPVHPAGIYHHNTLLMVMQEQFNIRLYPAHRLDRETSGAIIIAKNRETASYIQSNFHEVKKTYLAIAHGVPDADYFKIDVPLGMDRESPVRKKRRAGMDCGESAVTYIKKVSVFSGFTLFKAIPVTGRLHQIRAHLLYAGYPILGDKLYGLDEKFFLEFIERGNAPDLLQRIGFNRCALHSRSLSFYHPVLQKELSVIAPLPVDMMNFLKVKSAG